LVPARNEEDNLGRCLSSLVAQRGISFEVIVIDDHSADGTCALAQQFATPVPAAVRANCALRSAAVPTTVCSDLARVVVIEARSPLPEGWTGKANALWSGVRLARGEWLLFTDADTEHAMGSLASVVREAEENGADMLSLSPEQEVEGFCERALMPVIFAELAATYRPREVSDPAKPAAAANGQYLLIRRAVYDEVGGHEAVAGDLLEDVALARKVKGAGRKLAFRMGKGIVRTRMYRGWEQMREGWTKNLALLFPGARGLAYRRLGEFAALAGLPVVAGAAFRTRSRWLGAPALAAAGFFWMKFLLRMRRAHFDPLSMALSVFGLPLFASLLLASERAHGAGRVAWKGRNYCGAGISKKGARLNQS
jgi:glycosyltransferase involved in cell wall biosynthesis